MAETIKGINVVIGAETTGLAKALSDVDKRAKSIQSELKQVERLLKIDPKNTELLAQKQKLLGDAIANTREKLERLRAVQEQVNEQFQRGEISEGQYRAFQREIVKTEQDLQKLEKQLYAMEPAVKSLGERMQEAGDRMKKVGEKMTDAGQKLSIGVTAPIVGLGTVATKAAVDFESAFAGVRKTVDATEEEFAQLEQGIREMSKRMPAAATDIAAVAEAAGQLGIETPNILKFTEVMIGLGEATNLTAEEGATQFARFANIVGMSQNDFDRLGSAVVALGNSFATTEAEIVAMGMRLAGQGAQIGMAEAQIMALAAAMSSVGIEAEAGGTAMTTVLKRMQNAVSLAGEDLAKFAAVARMSATEFAEAFTTDPAAALQAFIDGLAASSAAGENLTLILSDLGITGIRESDTLLRLAGANDVLRSALETAMQAWEENIALQNEVAQRYATTESQLAMLRNQITDVAITLGQALIPMLIDMLNAAQPIINMIANWANWFANLDRGTQKVIVTITGLVAALGPMLIFLGKITSAIGTLITVLRKLSISKAEVGIAARGLSAAFAALTGPIGMVIAAIAALLTALTAVYRFFRADSIPTQGLQVLGDAAQKASERAVGSFKKVQNELRNTTEVARNELRNTTEVARAESPKIGDNLAKGIGGGARRGADEAVKAMRDAVDRMKQEVDRNRDALNRLGEALVEALKKQYQEMEEEQLKALDRQLENERRASEERIKIYDKEYAERIKLIDEEAYRQIKALQDQIDAIDAQTKAEEKELEEQEYRQRVSELRKRLEAAETAEERERIERELNKVIADYERRRLLEQRNAQKEALKEQIQAIREAADAQKEQLRAELEARKAAEQERLKAVEEALEAEKQSVRDHFAELTKQENLMAEARKLVIKKNNDEIIRLLSTYVPKWQDTGQSFADAFIYGLNSEKQSIEEAVREIVAIAPVIDDQMKQLEQMQARLESMTGRTAGGGGGGGVAGGFGGIAASIGDITANANELADTMIGQLVPAVEQVGESAQQMSDDAVEAFIGLRYRASVELNQLYWSGQQVSEQTASSIADAFTAMGQIIADNLDAAHAQQLQSTQQFLANVTTMTQEEKDKLLQNLQEAQAKEAEIVEQGQRRVAEILARALEEQRGLTKAEYDEINRIMANMTATAERTLSDYETKQKAIFEKMKIDASQLTALQAAEVVRNSLKQRDEAIKAAEEQYTNVVAEIIRQRDELGIITKEQADKLIAEAKRQRDEAVRHAEEMHQRVVEQAKKQAEEHVKWIDWETGEVKSRWRVLVDDMEQIGKDVIGGFIQGLKEKYKELRDYWRDIIESMPQQLKNLLRISSPSKVMMQLGEDTGEGFIRGLGNKITSIRREVAEMAAAVTETIGGMSTPRSATASGFAGSTINMDGLFAGATIVIRNDDDIRKLAREIWSMAQQAQRGLGGVRA